MSTRLNKVIRDLNVGSSRVIEFLQKQGFEIEDNNPNAKITDEQYELLVKEFSRDKDIKNESYKIRQEKKESNKNQSVSIEGYETDKKEAEKKQASAAPVKTPSEKQTIQIKTVGRIDLDNLNPKKNHAKAEPSVKEETAAPVKEETKKEAEKVVEEVVAKPEPVKEEKEISITENTTNSKVEEKPNVEPKKETAENDNKVVNEASDEVFKLNSASIVNKINVVGQIDLNAINQSTRPKKKSKEEKRKEREEKEKQRTEQRKKMKEAIIKEIRKDDDRKHGREDNSGEEDSKKKKRSRINKERVDINNINVSEKNNNKSQQDKQAKNQQAGNKHNKFKKSAPVKPEISEEDVAKQVKETLARLTSKGKNKAAKYRKEKREQAHNKLVELENQEMEESKILKLTEFVTANELASMMNVSVNQVIATCMSVGIMVSINQRLDAETINLVAEEFGFKTEYVSASVSQAITEEEDAEEDLQPRAPIVTVMGHVDHGKTSLLDYIRKSNVIAGEAGGITQHIGAYNVKLEDGRRITFLDTPGHEAFTAMRARGAKVTDIAIIIVAADDDVMPQTKEAINHAAAAGVPIVFAINKIDKPHANPDKIKEALANMNYLVEEWGGKYQSQDISAKKGIGVKELMEKVLLEAEMLDLKANPNRKATGSIIESTLDKGRGYVATVLVSNGTLKMGDIVLAGTNYGKIKAMFNERNQRITEAGPSAPAINLG